MAEVTQQTLEVVDSMQGITELAARAYTNEIPGFQVDEYYAKSIGLLAVMDAIESGSEQALDHVVPFTSMPFLYNEPGHYPPHIDGNMRGLAIHDNEHGVGNVQLAHLLDSTGLERGAAKIYMGAYTGDSRFYKGPGIDAVVDVAHGPVFEGELKPHRYTVFSQGNVDGMLRAVYFFTRTGRGNSWTRYSSQMSDENLSEDRLIETAAQFRLHLLWRSHNRLVNDKRIIKKVMKDNKTDERPVALDDLGIDLTLPEINHQLRHHPGKRVVSLGLDRELGLRFKKLNPAEYISHAIKDKVKDLIHKN